MRKQFANWLENQGYSYFTPEGRPSTIYDYAVRGLNKVCETEKISIEKLASKIDILLPKYQTGKHAHIGSSISRSCRCSLAQFSKFIKEQGA